MTDLETLTQQHEAYIEKCRARGDHLLSYTAPCCGGVIETRAPAPGERQWDTLATCVHCGEMHMKVVTHTEAKGLMP
jgi:hypothetical protein